jgi:hypothetical protein
MLSYRERKRISERERLRLIAQRDSLEVKKKKHALFAFVNKPIFLWFLSTIVIGLFTSVYASRNECRSDNAAQKLKLTHLASEINARAANILAAVYKKDWADISKQQGHDAEYTYVDFRFRTLSDIILDYESTAKTTYSKNVSCDVSVSGWPLPWSRTIRYYYTDAWLRYLLTSPDLFRETSERDKDALPQFFIGILKWHEDLVSAPPSFLRRCDVGSTIWRVLGLDQEVEASPDVDENGVIAETNYTVNYSFWDAARGLIHGRLPGRDMQACPPASVRK